MSLTFLYVGLHVCDRNKRKTGDQSKAELYLERTIK